MPAMAPRNQSGGAVLRGELGERPDRVELRLDGIGEVTAPTSRSRCGGCAPWPGRMWISWVRCRWMRVQNGCRNASAPCRAIGCITTSRQASERATSPLARCVDQRSRQGRPRPSPATASPPSRFGTTAPNSAHRRRCRRHRGPSRSGSRPRRHRGRASRVQLVVGLSPEHYAGTHDTGTRHGHTTRAHGSQAHDTQAHDTMTGVDPTIPLRV